MFVFSYIFQFISNLDDDDSHFTDAPVIMALEKVAKFLHGAIKRAEKTREIGKPPVPTHEIQSKQVELSEILVSSFFPDVVPRFFTVPKIHELNLSDQWQLNANEIMAGFIEFLLQVLFHQTNIGEAEVQRWALMRKELSFLLALLGDIPFQCTHRHHGFVQETNTLLAEFEMLANVAGSIVYDGVFSNHQMEANDFHAITLAWVEKIDILNANIKEHCSKFSELPMSVISRSRVVDSFFNIHSLIEDIENLKNHSLNFIHDDEIMERMRTLHDELTLSQSFIKVIIQDDEEKEVLVQIRDLTYDAEYLINSFFVGNMQVWYLKIRLRSVIHKIKLARIGLQQMSDSKLMKASDGKVSFPTTGNTETMDDIIQRILKDESEYMNELEVSYKHLPPEIKPCFLYFAEFPKYSEISQKKLTLLWIAEGFIQKQGNKSLEETAEMYLLYLIDRKFVLIVETGCNGAIKSCKIHTPMDEFCARKANEENFIKFANGFSMYEKCQRLCVAPTESCNSWRPFGLHCRSYRDLRTGQKSSCFQTMPLLKVLHRSPERYSCPAASTFPSQLRTLSYVCINGKEDEDILRCSPHLRKLKCFATDLTRFPDLSFLAELESLKLSFTANILWSEVYFPLNINKLCLDDGKLPWKMMSIIGRLPNLHVLKLTNDAFWGKVWETRDGEFQKLKCLKLFRFHSLRLWISCSEHFPVLECLVVEDCRELCDIPSNFRKIPTLQTIRLIESTNNAYLSALQIGKEIQVYLQDSCHPTEDKLVQKLRNWSRGDLMNVASWMEEYYKPGGSQQEFINKLPIIIIKDQTATAEGSEDRNLRIIDQTEDRMTTTTTNDVLLGSRKAGMSDIINGLRCIIQSHDGRKEILPGHPRYVDEIKKTRIEFSDMLVNIFIPQVQGFFQVSKIEHLYDHKGDKKLKKNEILAGSMDFLLQVLFCEVNTGSPVAETCALLHKELSFLRALMGDMPFQPSDHPEFGDQVNNLLAEFEMFANEAGGFLFSCVFPIQPISGSRFHGLAKILKAMIKKYCRNFSKLHVSAINGSRFHAETKALLGRAKSLKAKIKEHCSNFSKLPVSAILRSTVIDSFFIVQSLTEGLQSIILNGQLGNLTPDDATMENMKELHGELTLSQSFFEFIRENDCNEKKEGLVQIRHLAYEAEYLINSLSVGSIYAWYLNLRLPSIISKIKIASE